MYGMEGTAVNLTGPITELFRIVVHDFNSWYLLKHHAPCALGPSSAHLGAKCKLAQGTGKVARCFNLEFNC